MGCCTIERTKWLRSLTRGRRVLSPSPSDTEDSKGGSSKSSCWSVSDLWIDDNAAKKTYESRILEGQLSSDETVANSWFLFKQGAISSKIPPKIKVDRMTFRLEVVGALSAFPPTNKSILTDDEDNNVVIPLVKRSKRCNPPAIYVMAFIMAISR
ncbi:uncharacterized protein TNCV_562001 [Trichonephila clavipes]|uniref:Uncharacterized protein n=1 Tax=Trichonephila clavipes TaxID=2585209 RepID=A0A8X6S5D1_TRICX|nr:uncharacterized protein TNCV_562001 [Trichonephila clavipes]